MNEEDTFKALKKPTFAQMKYKISKTLPMYMGKCLIENGWTAEEFFKQVRDESGWSADAER